jgi:hypothetical protein
MSSLTCGCVYSDDGMGTPVVYCQAHMPVLTATPPPYYVQYIQTQCPHCVRLEAEVAGLRALLKRALVAVRVSRFYPHLEAEIEDFLRDNDGVA